MVVARRLTGDCDQKYEEVSHHAVTIFHMETLGYFKMLREPWTLGWRSPEIVADRWNPARDSQTTGAGGPGR